ncbi:hypothetical protein [Limnohabitans sp. INBF002]|uniref:hypothetical protein n=1 Tax=Limnohabitans sp. INBF002 TaxID=2986280 RepID=UPI00237782FE|nr:hypothetical protein [Limnohabitans sp. INBF002]BDU52023.1 hypothetical protein LINBF2_02580 [Limnohabitans sp. INBF002]
MKYYASLTAEVAKKELENIELKKSLAVRGDEVYVQQASLPQRKVSPKQVLVALLAMLSSCFALLIFVFIRKAWQSTVRDPIASGKVQLIRRLLCAGRD